MPDIVISRIQPSIGDVEIVERKGLGHPDTICDALAETFSRNLCRAYLDRCGEILHHNVDKALVCGGRARPAFGGGVVEALLSGFDRFSEILLDLQRVLEIGQAFADEIFRVFAQEHPHIRLITWNTTPEIDSMIARAREC
jgi:hypothetical protein